MKKHYFKPPFRMYNFDGRWDGWYINDKNGDGVTTACCFSEAFQLWWALNKTYTDLSPMDWPKRNFKMSYDKKGNRVISVQRYRK